LVVRKKIPKEAVKSGVLGSVIIIGRKNKKSSF